MNIFGLDVFRQFAFNSAAGNKDSIWFSTLNVNAVFSMDFETGNVKFVSWLPGEKTKFDAYSVAAIYNNDILVLIPHNAENVVLMNVNGEISKIIDVDIHKMGERNRHNIFSSAIIVGDMLWIFPGRYPGILIIDLVSFETEYLETMSLISKPTNDDCVYMWRPSYIEGCFFVPCMQSDEILIVRSEDFSIDVKQIDKTGDPGISGISKWKQSVLITHKMNGLISVLGEDMSETIEEISTPYIHGVKMSINGNDGIYLVPMNEDKFVKFDFENHDFTIICSLNTKRDIKAKALRLAVNNNFICCTRINDDDTIFYSANDLKIWVLNDKKCEFKTYDTEYDSDLSDYLYEQCKEELPSIMCEQTSDDLELYINGLLQL